MKKYITLLLLFLVLMPATISAKASYTKESLEDALKSEKIEYDLGDYTESDDKINIYLFRGDGCPHCQEFLEYVAKTLVKDEGDKFNIVSFEVWQNKDNADLMEKAAKKLGEDGGGVPFFIIGKKTFGGYSESMNEDIVNAIHETYESEDRYDILEVLDAQANEKSKTKKDNSSVVLLIVVSIAGIVVLVVTGLKKEK